MSASLQKLMNSSREEERVAALRRLREEDLHVPLSALATALGDSSWRVRKEAVDCFIHGAHRHWQVTDAIALLHSEDNAGLRNAATEALIRLGSSAVPALKAEMATGDQDVRKFVLDILGEIGDELCVGTLIEALADSDANVRAAAVENLGKLRAEEAVPALLDAMTLDDFSWHFTILEALARIGRTIPVEKLEPFRRDRLLCKALYDCLGSVGDLDALALLVQGLSDEQRNCREAAALALVKRGNEMPEAVAEVLSSEGIQDRIFALAQMLKGRNAAVRAAAARILAWIGDAAAARELLPLFQDESCAEQAMQALLDMGEHTVCALVRDNLGSDPMRDPYLVYLAGESRCVELADQISDCLEASDEKLRMVAARALAAIGSSTHVGQLVDLLEDQDDDVREAAVYALCSIGQRTPAAVVGRLVPLVEAELAVVRRCVVQILGDIDAPSCRPYLAMAFKDPAPNVRQAAIHALAQNPDNETVATLALALTDEDAEVRALVAESLGVVGGEKSFDCLGSALEDEDIWVRVKALRSLGRLGGERAFGLITQALEDPVGMVVLAAVEALRDIDVERARPYLLKALDSEDAEVVKVALHGLGALADRAGVAEVVQKLIDHPLWDVRLAVVNMLAKPVPEALRLVLENRLSIEGDDLVRQAMEELLPPSPEHREMRR